MTTEDVMDLVGEYADIRFDMGTVLGDCSSQESGIALAKVEAAINRLTQAEALLAEMAHNRDAGYHFSSDSDWSTCPFCGYVTFLEGDRGHMEDCPITRARELLGIEV